MTKISPPHYLKKLICFCTIILLLFQISFGQTQSIINISSLSQSQLTSGQLEKLNRLSGSTLHDNFQLVEVQNLSANQVNGKVRLILSNLSCSDLIFTATKVEYTSENDYYWYGIIDSDVDSACKGGSLTLMAKAGDKFGTIVFDDYSYEFQDLGNGIQALSRVKLEAFNENECAVNQNTPGPDLNFQPPKNSGPPNIIYPCDPVPPNCNVRVLVLYTQAAQNIEADINNRIALAIAQVNQAYLNSQVSVSNVSLVLAGSQKISFTEGTIMRTDVDNLAANSTVQTLRNNFLADIVILLTNGNYGDVKGIVEAIGPNFNGAYAIVQTNAATGGRHTFAHEVGHLFGARHFSDPNGTIEHGYIFITGFIFTKHRYTLLADLPSGKTRELNYSNPDVEIKHKPTGISATHNNAQKHRNTGCTVANFFPNPSGVMGIDILQPNPNVCCTTVTAEAEVSCGVAPYYFNWTISYDEINWQLLPNSEIVTFNTDCDKQVLTIELTVTDALGQNRTIRKHYNADCGMTYIQATNAKKSQSNIIERIFPNPSSTIMKVYVNLKSSENVKIDIIDIYGNIRKQVLNSNLSKGYSTLIINTAVLSSGTYQLRAISKDRTEYHQILVIK